ncbi:hypothetical protein M408DRAFT_5587 [Serendipita vermifera MAFF 305830]|uniref:DUF159-domain-containing protein n=1 Tax=Serendipita vermifera MAFF 305830 TaxID=933852 RepID=A0A0C3BSE2_SERVB|nr:hypothetical protein M408DRAFT_5587 [Serendipita vermifera MAFF 305830]
MCGRFALGDNHEEIFEQLIRDGILPGAGEPEWRDRDAFHPRYNVAPQSRAAVIRQRSTSEDSGQEAPEQVAEEAEGDQSSEAAPAPTPGYTTLVQTMKWGVLPRGKTQDAPRTLNTINAKIETILEGSYLWSPLVDSQRCVVICDGYYEWQTKGKSKLPYFIRHQDATRKLYFAGLWEKSNSTSEGELINGILSVAIDPPSQTTRPPSRPEMEWLHERMPLIFSPTCPTDMEKLAFWLDPKNTWSSGIKAFLESYSSDIPPEVGKVGNESPAFIQPIEERKDGIKASFAKQQQTPKGKRRRSITPESPSKRVKTEPTEPPPNASPFKKPPPSPKRQSPSKKSKFQAKQSMTLDNFFSRTSPRKGE